MNEGKYDFVGVSSKQLPFVHESFPQGANFGSPRYCTTRSMYRGRDAERKRYVSLQRNLKGDTKTIANVKLPKLELDVEYKIQRNYVDPTLHPSGNIYRQKAFLKLNGIPIDQLYSIHRSKQTEVVPSYGESRESLKNGKYSKRHGRRSRKHGTDSVLSNTTSNATLSTLKLAPLKTPDTKASDACYTTTPNSDLSESSDPLHKSRLLEMDRLSPIPGILRPKKSNRGHGRKLGNIVSSRRLQQILDNDEEPLDPGAFYFY